MISALVLVPTAKVYAYTIYTFEGITLAPSDPYGLISSWGLSIGMAVTYQFGVERNALGSVVKNDGTIAYYAGGTQNNYFHVDFLGGNLFQGEINGGFYNASNRVATYHLGEVNIALDPAMGSRLHGKSEDWRVQVYHNTLSIDNWFVGLNLKGYEDVIDPVQHQAFMYSNVVLTSISVTPLPGSFWLFGVGLIGFIWVYTRKKNDVIIQL